MIAETVQKEEIRRPAFPPFDAPLVLLPVGFVIKFWIIHKHQAHWFWVNLIGRIVGAQISGEGAYQTAQYIWI